MAAKKKPTTVTKASPKKSAEISRAKSLKKTSAPKKKSLSDDVLGAIEAEAKKHRAELAPDVYEPIYEEWVPPWPLGRTKQEISKVTGQTQAYITKAMGEPEAFQQQLLSHEDRGRYLTYLQDQSVYLRAAIEFYAEERAKGDKAGRRQNLVSWGFAPLITLLMGLATLTSIPAYIYLPLLITTGITAITISALKVKHLKEEYEHGEEIQMYLVKVSHTLDETITYFQLAPRVSLKKADSQVSNFHDRMAELRGAYLLDEAGIQRWVPRVQMDDMSRLSVGELVSEPKRLE